MSSNKHSFRFLCTLLLMVCVIAVSANTEITLDVHGEKFTLQRFSASGDQLILYVAPGYGFNDRGTATAQNLSKLGIEVWMVDLANNLFLPPGNSSMRSVEGRYVASIIEQAHKQSGKRVTLLSSSYGAIPVLKGAREWQLNNRRLKRPYLNGAIFFSPELYRTIPALGADPEFEPIASATNIPVMIYQSELRNNRWQLDNVIRKLEVNNAVVYRKILPGITSFFYEIDTKPDTLKALREIPAEIPQVIRLLELTPFPLRAANLSQPGATIHTGVDIQLKAYKGGKTPLPLDMVNINGQRVVRNDYAGKVTLVNFWATWCPPCVQEIPSLNRLIAKMKSSNFELLSINYAEEKTTIAEFLKKVDVKFPVLLDEKGRAAASWNIIALPSTFIIGPDGKFAYGVNAALEWDSPEVVESLTKLAGQ